MIPATEGMIMTTIPNTIKKKVGIAGVGAIGGAVARALMEGNINGFTLQAISDPAPRNTFDAPCVDFDTLANQSDLIIECLPAHIVPQLAKIAFKANKDIIFISSAALLVYPEILEAHKASKSIAHVPSGALCGLDGVKAMRGLGIQNSKIATTKKPSGYSGAPYVVDHRIDLESIKTRQCIFKGNALEASIGFPANINVAATLSLAGIGAEKTMVEIWADPLAKGNTHEITVQSQYSTMVSRIENMPDPANPKSSVLAAQSIITMLHDMSNALVIG